MSRIVLGIICGLVFGAIDIGIMLSMRSLARAFSGVVLHGHRGSMHRRPALQGMKFIKFRAKRCETPPARTRPEPRSMPFSSTFSEMMWSSLIDMESARPGSGTPTSCEQSHYAGSFTLRRVCRTRGWRKANLFGWCSTRERHRPNWTKLDHDRNCQFLASA
jgi:hypothetical protein